MRFQSNVFGALGNVLQGDFPTFQAMNGINSLAFLAALHRTLETAPFAPGVKFDSIMGDRGKGGGRTAPMGSWASGVRISRALSPRPSCPTRPRRADPSTGTGGHSSHPTGKPQRASGPMTKRDQVFTWSRRQSGLVFGTAALFCFFFQLRASDLPQRHARGLVVDLSLNGAGFGGLSSSFIIPPSSCRCRRVSWSRGSEPARSPAVQRSTVCSGVVPFRPFGDIALRPDHTNPDGLRRRADGGLCDDAGGPVTPAPFVPPDGRVHGNGRHGRSGAGAGNPRLHRGNGGMADGHAGLRGVRHPYPAAHHFFRAETTRHNQGMPLRPSGPISGTSAACWPRRPSCYGLWRADCGSRPRAWDSACCGVFLIFQEYHGMSLSLASFAASFYFWGCLPGMLGFAWLCARFPIPARFAFAGSDRHGDHDGDDPFRASWAHRDCHRHVSSSASVTLPMRCPLTHGAGSSSEENSPAWRWA